MRIGYDASLLAAVALPDLAAYEAAPGEALLGFYHKPACFLPDTWNCPMQTYHEIYLHIYDVGAPFPTPNYGGQPR